MVCAKINAVFVRYIYVNQKGAKPNDMREKLKKWREEKALKKKSEAREKAKKQPFIIKHVIPTEKLHPSTVKKGIADSSKVQNKLFFSLYSAYLYCLEYQCYAK